MILSFKTYLVYCETREKKVYFSNVKFDAPAKRGQQSHEKKNAFPVLHMIFFYWGVKK